MGKIGEKGPLQTANGGLPVAEDTVFHGLDRKRFSGRRQARLDAGLKAGAAPGLSAEALTWVLECCASVFDVDNKLFSSS